MSDDEIILSFLRSLISFQLYFIKKELRFFMIRICLEPARICLLRDDEWVLMVSPQYLNQEVTSKSLRI